MLDGVVLVVGYQDAFARCQTIGLDHIRRTGSLQCLQEPGAIRHIPRLASGHACCRHNFFGKRFGALESCCVRARPKNGYPRFAEPVGNTRDQRCFGANNDKVNVGADSKLGNHFRVGRVESHDLGVGSNARIAGCCPQLVLLGVSPESLNDGVFTRS